MCEFTEDLVPQVLSGFIRDVALENAQWGQAERDRSDCGLDLKTFLVISVVICCNP